MAKEMLHVVDLIMTGGSLHVAWQTEPGTLSRGINAATMSEANRLVAALAEQERKVQGGAGSAALRAAQAALGAHLYLLLDGPERALARREAEARAAAQRLNLVVRLRTAEEGPLVRHPATLWRWEHLATERGPLALDSQVRLGVQLGEFVPRDGEPPRAQAKLRLLFMACSAHDVEPVLDYEHEEETLADALSDFVANGKVALRVVEEGSLERLRARLMDESYDVVHLTGHGLLTDEGPRFVMEDVAGARRDVSAEELLRVFNDAREMPYLVVISSCWSTGVRGDLPSLAARMVAGGVPSVIGWVRPVRDDVATEAARDLYERLCVGESPMQAATHARQRLHEDDTKRSVPSHAWGTLQLLTREAPGPRLALTADGTEGDVTQEVLYRMLGRSMRVLERGFVGRRRELQRLVRLLREGKDGQQPIAGAVVCGMKGQGKSCLVGRALERHMQDVGNGTGVGLVVVGGAITDSNVLEAFRERAIAWGDEEAERALNDTARPTLFRVERLLRGRWRNRRLVIVLDDFEHNLDVPGVGLASLKPAAAALLEAVVPPCITGRPKVLITSTARFAAPTKLRDTFVEMDLNALDAASVRKLWLRGQQSGELAHVLPGQWIALAERLGRNARVLEWVRQLLGGKTPREVEELVKRVGEVPLDWQGRTPTHAEQTQLATIFLRHLALDEAKAKVNSDALAFVQRARVYDAPVPPAAFTELADGLAINLAQHLPALANLGLLEVGNDDGVRVYRANPLVEPSFDAPDGERWHQAAARYFHRSAMTDKGYRVAAIYGAWEHALAGGEQPIADWAAAVLMVGLDARGVFAESVALARRHLARFPESIEGACWEAYAVFRMGDLVTARTKLAHAETLASKPGVPRELRGRVRDSMARVLAACGDLRGARDRFEELLGEEEAAHPEGSLVAAIIHHELGNALLKLGDVTQARIRMERALLLKQKHFGTEEHQDVAMTLQGLATVQAQLGDLERARTTAERALDILRRGRGTDEHLDVATALFTYAAILREQRRLGEAREALERSIAILCKVFGTEEHLDVAASLHALAGVLHRLGDLPGARKNLTRAIEILRRGLGTEEHLDLAASLHMMAGILHDEGDLKGERAFLERSLEIKRKLIATDDHPDVATSLHELALAVAAEGRRAEAIALLEHALQIRERVFKSRDHYYYAETEAALGCLLCECDRTEEATPLLEHAMLVLSEQVPDHPLLAQLREIFDLEGAPSMPELVRMALLARDARTALPPELDAGLAWLRNDGGMNALMADFLAAIAHGVEVPEVPTNLPKEIRERLAQVAEAATRREVRIDLGALVHAALGAREGTAIPEAELGVIEYLERAGPLYATVARFLRELAQRGLIPDMPDNMLDELRDTLENARQRAAVLDGIERRETTSTP